MTQRTWLACLLTLVLLVLTRSAPARADVVDWQPRLDEIYTNRAAWLLADQPARPLEVDYLPGSAPARWALKHEQGKIGYVRTWAELRGVRVVQATPAISYRVLRQEENRVRFLVRESLAVGYAYPDASTVERFGVGAAHVLELRRHEGRWLIHSEWYEDALGQQGETPDRTRGRLPAPAASGPPAGSRGRYDRQGALAYAERYCGLGWGCGNDRRYNARFRDYNGNGGDCTNFVSQALRIGGKLPIPVVIRVEALAARLQHAGLAHVTARGAMHTLWGKAAATPKGFRAFIREGDLIAYQDHGRLAHFAIVTGFDSHGYPLINSHTADRHHAPFDTGWDKRTVYWLFRVHD